MPCPVAPTCWPADVEGGDCVVGYEREALDGLFATVAASRSQMQTRLMRAGKGEPFVLRYLQRHGTSTPSQLASALRASSGRISALLTVLERKGFVTREINPADRRGIIVSITTEGKEFGTARFNEAITSMRDLVDDLGEEDTKELVRILERIQDRIIERTGIEPPPLG